VKYKSSGPAALNNINFAVKSKEKIGIVGRTGAGKSTLGMTLFRIMEPTSGSIIIDGVDITEIGLDDLRSRLAIIPQEPVLFTGTIRFNLDPFDQYTDREIWDALDRVSNDN
jgi:ATP-binding cassette subfamily C (CFTR/MRP) protein 5